MNVEKPYGDIIDIAYPFDTGRTRMSLHDRASQFAPFAALTGYDSLIGDITRMASDETVTEEDSEYCK